jgi:hypothetical protein
MEVKVKSEYQFLYHHVVDDVAKNDYLLFSAVFRFEFVVVFSKKDR